ncbi:MAG: hypothetical protein H6807_17010 [Planctomycetes bacterium]|nr:hypothetical protein [Planctomycetota bacterium]
MKRGLVIAAILALVSLVVLVVIEFVTDGRPSGLGISGSAADRAAAEAQRPARNVADEEAPVAQLDGPEPATPAAAVATSGLEPRDWDHPFRLRIVDETGRGIPGVRAELSAWAAAGAPVMDSAASGADGRLLIDRRGTDIGVLLWPCGPYEMTWIDPNLGNRDRLIERVVMLPRRRAIPVRVLGAGDVGLPGVALKLLVGPNREGDEITLSYARTDGDGRAWLVAEPRGGEIEGHIVLDLPRREPIRVPVDLANLPTTEVVLHAPAGGALVLRPTERLARMLAPGEWLTLEAVGDDHDLSVSLGLGPDGAWHFDQLEPGLIWRPSFEYESPVGLLDGEQAVFLGPAAAGECVERTLDLAGEAPLVEFRLLGPDGSPAAGILVDLLPCSDPEEILDPDYRLFKLRTDAEGRGRFLLDQERLEDAGGSLDGVLRIAVATRGVIAHADAPFCDFTLPALPWPATLSLGEGRLHRQPLLVGGRVLGAAGEPLVGARVILTMAEDTIRHDSVEEPWSAARWLCAPDGSFAIHRRPPVRDEGEAAADEDADEDEEDPDDVLILLADAPGHRRRLLGRICPGMSDLEIRLAPAVDVEFRVLVDAGWDLSPYAGQVSGAALAFEAPADSENTVDRFRIATRLGGGRYRIDSVGPGELEFGLVASYGDSEDEIWSRLTASFRIAPEQIEAGKTVELEVDLRGRCPLTTLEIVGERDQGLEAFVLPHCLGQVEAPFQASAAGLLSIPDLLLRGGIRVSRAGYWTETFATRPDVTRIRLQPAEPVEVRLLGASGKELPAELAYGLQINSASESLLSGNQFQGARQRILVEMAGPLGVEFSYRRADGEEVSEWLTVELEKGAKTLEIRIPGF